MPELCDLPEGELEALEAVWDRRTAAGVATSSSAEVATPTDGVAVDLARWYASLFNAYHAAGLAIPRSLLDGAASELADSGVELAGDAHGWTVHQDGRPLQYEQHRSPVGGVSINSKFYRGGMFIPSSEVAKLSKGDKAKLEAGEKERKGRLTARGDVSHAQVTARVQAHKDTHTLDKDELTASKRSLAALHRHHGDLTLHRLDEMAEGLEEALAGLPEGETGIRRQFERRLAALHHMAGWAKERGVEPPQVEAKKEEEPEQEEKTGEEPTVEAKKEPETPAAGDKAETATGPWHGHREEVFAVMRQVRDQTDAAWRKAQELGPRGRDISVGGADFDYTLKGVVGDAYLRALNQGQTPDEALAAATAEGRYAVDKWNKQGSRGRAAFASRHELHRWEGAGDDIADNIHRRFTQALKKSAAPAQKEEPESQTNMIENKETDAKIEVGSQQGAGAETAQEPEGELLKTADVVSSTPTEKKTKDGVVWAQAKAGGEVSPVNGQHYKGGQWMPIHGLSEKRAAKPAQEPQGGTMGKANEDAKKKEQGRRGPMSPEAIEAEREYRERRAMVDEIMASPLQQLTGVNKNNGAPFRTGPGHHNWRDFAETLTSEQLQAIVDRYKPTEGYALEEFGWALDHPQGIKSSMKGHHKKFPGSAEAYEALSVGLGNAKTTDAVLDVARFLQGLKDGKPVAPSAPTPAAVSAKAAELRGQLAAGTIAQDEASQKLEAFKAGKDVSQRIVGTPTPEHRTAAARWADASPGLSPSQATEYTEHLAHALSVLPVGAGKEAAAALAHGKVQFHPDLKTLRAEAKAFNGASAASVVGFARDHGQGTDLHLDGGDDPRGTYIHELWHAADNSSFHSDDLGWQKAYKKDILKGKHLLSRYALVNSSEGLAEFGRVLAERGLAHMTEKFPNAVKHLQTKGLI